jgi:hypothetical protein
LRRTLATFLEPAAFDAQRLPFADVELVHAGFGIDRFQQGHAGG